MRLSAALLATLLAPATLIAQPQPRALTAADYARAEQYMSYNAAPLVTGGSARPVLLDGDRFWYRSTIAGGAEFVVVDPARKTRARLFDQDRLATALSAATGRRFDALHLPFMQFDLSADARALDVDVASKRWRCDLIDSKCTAGADARGATRDAAVSPDGRRAAFIRDHNLWVRDLATGRESQLTTDGVKDFGYATDNAGWTRSARAIVLWSPDSKKIATFQQDERGVGEMYLVDSRVGHPKLQAWKYPLVGDSIITTIQRVVIDVDRPSVVRLKMPADEHRSTICDHIACRGGEFSDVQWSDDATRLFFVSSSRDHKKATLREADPTTGVVRDIMQETVPTFYESGFNKVNWQVLPATNEVLWYSQRDDWGHLYLYDLRTGQLQRQITKGAWNVLQVLRVDEKTRTIFFVGSGREAGRDPYFRHYYRVKMDGSALALLTPENADHDITPLPSGRYFVDSYSTPSVPPVTVVRDADGRVQMTLEKADISRLVATGWTPPISFTVKARDGKTDLYGLMYRPTGFDSTKRYPIVNQIYPGPQTGSVGSRSFSPARGDTRALAELGFIVIQLDAMGTPMRSKSFHTAYYGNMGDNGLPDQIAGMKQLAQRYRWIDLDRAGIWGHSGGGFATADAMLRYPDFFKVGIAESGNHDQRTYEDDWGEKYHGLLEHTATGTNYDDQANQSMAKNLKGKLLLAHGTLDDNVPPNNTLVLADALIKANKDFDLIMIPNARHGYAGASPWMTRRRWDYFVKNLMGAEPPKEYEMKPPASPFVP